MKKLFSKNIAVSISGLVLIGAVATIFFFLAREKQIFSLEETISENFIMLTVLFSATIISMSFNLVSIYKNFAESLRIFTFIKVLLLNVPLLLLQCVFLFAWLILNADV